jgi:putative transcription factor
MSQKDVAKALDAKPQMIADWETGKAIPSTAAMGKLAQVLGAKLPGPGTPAAEKKLAAEKRIAAAGAKKSGVGKTVLAEKKGTPANARA